MSERIKFRIYEEARLIGEVPPMITIEVDTSLIPYKGDIIALGAGKGTPFIVEQRYLDFSDSRGTGKNCLVVKPIKN